MLFRQLLNQRCQRLSYLVADRRGGEALLIDPHPSQRTVVNALLSDCQLSGTVGTIGEKRRRNPFSGRVSRKSFIARFGTKNQP